MKYKCLILDHDDTTVDSTAHVHHPSFLRSMAKLRPGLSMTLEEYFELNATMGVTAYYKNVLKLTPEEAAWEYKQWVSYASSHVPTPFPGMKEIIARHKAEGGYLCVVSHNLKDNILRDYKANGMPQPDLIYGCELPAQQQKPNPYPIYDILDKLNLKREDLLMVDDSIPGCKMAKAAGIDFAAACWAHAVPFIRAFLQENHAPIYNTPTDLGAFLWME